MSKKPTFFTKKVASIPTFFKYHTIYIYNKVNKNLIL